MPWTIIKSILRQVLTQRATEVKPAPASEAEPAQVLTIPALASQDLTTPSRAITVTSPVSSTTSASNSPAMEQGKVTVSPVSTALVMTVSWMEATACMMIPALRSTQANTSRPRRARTPTPSAMTLPLGARRRRKTTTRFSPSSTAVHGPRPGHLRTVSSHHTSNPPDCRLRVQSPPTTSRRHGLPTSSLSARLASNPQGIKNNIEMDYCLGWTLADIRPDIQQKVDGWSWS